MSALGKTSAAEGAIPSFVSLGRSSALIGGTVCADHQRTKGLFVPSAHLAPHARRGFFHIIINPPASSGHFLRETMSEKENTSNRFFPNSKPAEPYEEPKDQPRRSEPKQRNLRQLRG